MCSRQSHDLREATAENVLQGEKLTRIGRTFKRWHREHKTMNNTTDTSERLTSRALFTSLRPRIMLHREVGPRLYDIFGVVAEARRWAFGIRISDYTDRRDALKTYGVRLIFWRWHLCWFVKGKANDQALPTEGAATKP